MEIGKIMFKNTKYPMNHNKWPQVFLSITIKKGEISDSSYNQLKNFGKFGRLEKLEKTLAKLTIVLSQVAELSIYQDEFVSLNFDLYDVDEIHPDTIRINLVGDKMFGPLSLAEIRRLYSQIIEDNIYADFELNEVRYKINKSKLFEIEYYLNDTQISDMDSINMNYRDDDDDFEIIDDWAEEKHQLRW